MIDGAEFIGPGTDIALWLYAAFRARSAPWSRVSIESVLRTRGA